MAFLTLDGSVNVNVAAIPGGVEESEVIAGDFGRNVDGGALSSRRTTKRHVRFTTTLMTAAAAATLITKLQKKTPISVTGDYVSMSALGTVHRISSVPVKGSYRKVLEFTLKEV